MLKMLKYREILVVSFLLHRTNIFPFNTERSLKDWMTWNKNNFYKRTFLKNFLIILFGNIINGFFFSIFFYNLQKKKKMKMKKDWKWTSYGLFPLQFFSGHSVLYDIAIKQLTRLKMRRILKIRTKYRRAAVPSTDHWIYKLNFQTRRIAINFNSFKRIGMYR